MQDSFLNRGQPSMTYNVYLSALLMAATCCSLLLVYLCFKRRDLPIAVSYGLGMLTGSFYSFGYAFEIISTSLEHIRFWLRVEYIGIPFGTVLWFIMVLQYTGRQSWVRPRNIALLMIIPLITFTAHNTNELHHLFYKSMTLNDTEGFPLVTLIKGPLYELHVFYSYSFFIVGMVLLLQMFFRAVPRMKKQIALMIIGSWGPFGFTLIYLSGVIYMPIDISPFGFLFSGVFYMWGIYQFNMLRLAPLALQQVFESMEEAVIILDTDNSLTSFNRSAKGIVSELNNKSSGQPAVQVFSEYPLLLEMIAQGEDSASRIQLAGPDGDFYNVHLSLVRNKRLKIVGKMLLLREVTEAVHAEEKLRDNARQLSELNMFKDRMFSVVAHDIRDPLAVLVNLMELLEEEMQAGSGDHDEEILHEMGQQIQNTFELVEVLLDWFRSQREGMIFDPVERDLTNTVQASLRLLRLRSDTKQIQIISEIPEESYVYADKVMLDLIIRNLLSNAIKFSYRGGNIRLKAERRDRHMVIAVSDTGGGISPEHAGTLLQDDYRSSSTGTSGERGVGLGLTLCREFVQLNGGELWFDSIPSKGSTFYFSLPLPPEAPLIPAGNSIRKGMIL